VTTPSEDAPGKPPGNAPAEPPENAPAGTPGGVTDGQETPSEVQLPGKQPAAGEPAGEPPVEDQQSLPARRGEERIAAPVVRMGMFGVTSTGDTSGYGRLQVHKPLLPSAEPPYGGYFDAVAQGLGSALETGGLGFTDAIERVVVDHGELTFHVRREHLVAVVDKLLHEPTLQFEIFSGVSGVHYPDEPGRELHAVYHLLSITHNRRVRLEVSIPDADPHLPSVTDVYPAANWHERETWDFFGIIFDGHPALTRIEMPDDWLGHPQRKDYPLGGIPVEYRGTKMPPPDERRSYS
jgi:NADH-quinone oxidoreductase subunit C